MPITYRVYDSPLALSSYVRYFWSIDHPEDGGIDKIIKIFADRFPRLIFQDLNGHTGTKDDNGQWLPQSFLSGIITRQTNYHVNGSYAHVGVSFYPHAIQSIFGIDAFELTDGLPDLVNFCSPELVNRLQDASSHDERVSLISEMLINKLDKQKWLSRIHPIIHSCVKYNTTIGDILVRHQLSERALERLFKSSIGLTPKKYLRILRFEKTVEMLTSMNSVNLTALAYDFEYADQSHFNKEFKEFSGFTPQAFQGKIKFGQESSSFLLK